ncbi:DUF1835 domain-containing protein [Abyssalbus ytuae]|uniref:DUF1835 domain-containing protein n=1 Tax=Abyssalbus ytuae TaxID=2926907 RepID=A0A9E7D1T8_9FLAO|nr:DUF1835 domain-containing protein [Abyssalbus ytuae]UOB17453.1 DUF1835 domain-containing protein [Abyssalbus ytuae]
MSKTLHITNGDSFTSILKNLGIKGEIITWREMLCEGKTTTDVGSESFWRTRFDFLHNTYKVSKDTFINFTLKEYRNLCNQKSQEEIVLWFEYDLYCQVNMIAVLSWLKKYRSEAHISLVNSGNEDESPKMYGLSELSNEKLLELYENRIHLTKDDIEYADYIWQLYCSDNPIRLETAILQDDIQFKYLNDAVHSHLLRFPSIKNGLNNLENKVIEIAAKEQIKDKDQFISYLIKNQGLYGYSDLQFIKMLKRLKPLIKTFKPVTLTKLGNAVLEKTENFYPLVRNENVYLGGAPKYAFLYNDDNDKLLKL